MDVDIQPVPYTGQWQVIVHDTYHLAAFIVADESTARMLAAHLCAMVSELRIEPDTAI